LSQIPDPGVTEKFMPQKLQRSMLDVSDSGLLVCITFALLKLSCSKTTDEGKTGTIVQPGASTYVLQRGSLIRTRNCSKGVRVVEKKLQILDGKLYKTCRFSVVKSLNFPRTSFQGICLLFVPWLNCIAVAMKFTAILVALIATVSVGARASHLHTNADRLINGLPPLPPARRGTPVLCKWLAAATLSFGLTSGKLHARTNLREYIIPATRVRFSAVRMFRLVSVSTKSIFFWSSTIGNSVTHADDGVAHLLEELFGLVVSKNTAVGVTCHPLSPIGIGGNHW